MTSNPSCDIDIISKYRTKIRGPNTCFYISKKWGVMLIVCSLYNLMYMFLLILFFLFFIQLNYICMFLLYDIKKVNCYLLTLHVNGITWSKFREHDRNFQGQKSLNWPRGIFMHVMVVYRIIGLHHLIFVCI